VSTAAALCVRLIAALRSGSWLTPDRLAGYPRLFLALWLTAAAGMIATSHGGVDRNGQILGTDFLDVYAASELALAGRPAEIYDYRVHGQAEHQVADTGGYYGWHYPPVFLLVALPAALLPYGWALCLWLSATFAVYWAAIRAALPAAGAAMAALAFPAVWVNIAHGQNAFLTAGLLGFGLLLLHRRPALAGLLFGLLCYKPQFGLLLPVALVAGRHWRAIAAAAASALAVAAASLAAFGPATWRAFIASMDTSRRLLLEQGALPWPKIQSVFAAVRLLGGGAAPAYAVQAVATAAAMVAVAAAWRRCRDPALCAAALVAAMPLATPYVLDYDLVILALPIAWLVRAGGATGFRPWEKTVLAATWVLPLVARPAGFALGLPLTPPLLAVLLGLILARAFRGPEISATAAEP
jgi:hypothetical protein